MHLVLNGSITRESNFCQKKSCLPFTKGGKNLAEPFPLK